MTRTSPGPEPAASSTTPGDPDWHLADAKDHVDPLRGPATHAPVSQEDLAGQVGLDHTYVSGIERGIRNPTFLVLLRLA